MMTLIQRSVKVPSASVRSGDGSDDGCGDAIRKRSDLSHGRKRQRRLKRPRQSSRPCFCSVIVLSGTAILSFCILLRSPPGKNYFQASFWRRSHRLSTLQRANLYQNVFPLHVDESEFESIPHPGYLLADKDWLQSILAGQSFESDSDTLLASQNLTVPKFWDPVDAFGHLKGGVREFLGNQGQFLVSPEEAGTIGSFHSVTGEPTIFVALASYRDPECLPTVESIFIRAKSPERIRIAIVDQRRQHSYSKDPSCQPPTFESCQKDPTQTLCPYIGNIDRTEYSAELMTGPVLARHLAYRMYRGEYFALQVDSHVRFVAGWDEDIISQWRSTENDMAVISTYMNDITNSIDPATHQSKRTSRAMMCDSEYEWKGDNKEHIRFKIQPTNRPKIIDSPMLQPFWAAGFSFARGHFLISVPYDPYLPFVFQGEEILQSIRAFTFGYDIYAPVRSVAFHIYGMKENLESRRNVPHFDENEILYPGAKRRAYQRLIGVAGTTSPALDYDHFEEDKYGIGMVRSRRQFFETFGIHPEKREIERDLCDFVQGSFGAETSMHAIFSPFLRYDHMGIDYSRITHRHMTRDRSDTPVDDKELNFLKDQLRKNKDGLSEQGRVAFPK